MVVRRKTPATNDTFCMASSVMHRFTINVPWEPQWFRACAEGYLLSGRLNDICDHNATVARNASRNDVSNPLNFLSMIIRLNCIIINIPNIDCNQISTVWSIIKTLYANPMGSILKTPPTASKEDIVNTLNLAQITIGSGIDQPTAGKSVSLDYTRLNIKSTFLS